MIYTKENLKEEISRLLSNLGDGDISPSAYDTAWVARLRDDNNSSLSKFPKALEWVRLNQNKDGSWGDDQVNQRFDKAISTLNCVIALKLNNIEPLVVDKGIEYLNRNISKLKDIETERLTVGFEMLFPTLINEAKELGITINDQETISFFEELRSKKILKLPLEVLYKFKTVYNYSLEFLAGTDADFEKISHQVEVNGSFASSPASTAFMLTKSKIPSSIKYIEELLNKFGFIPDFYPFPEFEKSWILSYFIQLNIADEFKTDLKPHADFLEESWNDQGVAFSKYFGVVDLDITSTIFKVLHVFGYEHKPNVFKNFEDDVGFYCYKGEAESSISHIANFMDCLNSSFTKDEVNPEIIRMYKKAESFMNKKLLNNLSDKWNTSKYYTYSRIPFFRDKSYKDFTSKAINFLKTTQNSNGSWGKGLGDIEETCWAIITLLKIYSEDEFIKLEEVKSAYLFLLGADKGNRSNWISKVLYCPVNIRNILYLVIIYKLQILFSEYDTAKS